LFEEETKRGGDSSAPFFLGGPSRFEQVTTLNFGYYCLSDWARQVFCVHFLRLTNATPGIVQLFDPDGTVIDQTAPFKDEDND
jgi:hypothetical protein